MRQTIILIIAALLALAAGITVERLANPTTVPPTTRPQLDFSLPDSNGTLRHINTWRDKVMVINFWATWCPPCLKEIPQFVKLQEELSENDIQFIGIAVEDAEPVIEFLRDHSINYPILIGGDAGISLSQQLGNIVNAVPFTLIVNREGQIVFRHPGELSREKLLQELKPLIQ